MRKIQSIMMFLIFGLAVALPTIALAAPSPPVDICHLSDTGDFIMLSINSKALSAHLAHGDGFPDDYVLDQPGWIFDDNCLPIELVPDLSQGVIPIAVPCFNDIYQFSNQLGANGCESILFGDPDLNVGQSVDPGEDNWDKLVLITNIDETFPGCDPAGCDFDFNGIYDITPSQLTLDLNGSEGTGSSEIVDWIIDGFWGSTIFPYTWVPLSPGDNVAAFYALKSREGEILPIPVFNFICVGMVEDCLQYVPDPQPSEPIIFSGSSYTYLRVIGWEYFYISCVSVPGYPMCPLKEIMVQNGYIVPNQAAVEGYLIPSND